MQEEPPLQKIEGFQMMAKRSQPRLPPNPEFWGEEDGAPTLTLSVGSGHIDSLQAVVSMSVR